jgi:imidazolonepropionase-like amidohydrolase
MSKAIKVGLLIDGTGRDPISDVAVVLNGTTIQAVVPQSEISSISQDVELVDVTDAVLLPGLIDTHVHLGNPQVSDVYAYRVETLPTLTVFYAARSAQQALVAGFTTLRNMGGIEFVSLRQAVEAGLVPAPRILTAGMVLMTGGHTDRLLPASLPRKFGQPADGVTEVRKRVREYVLAGADFIKFEATGGLLGLRDQPSTRNYSQGEIEAIVDEAHGLGVRVAAHAHSTEGILRAIEAGADSIEHGTYVDEECAARMASDGVFLVPTVAILHDAITRAAELGLPPAVVTRLQEFVDERLASVERAHRAGVKIALGTDSSGRFAPHGRNAVEFELLAQAGLSPMESLMAGTSVAAEALGLDASIGGVEPGKEADLLVVRSNPLEDLAVLQDPANIVMVWKGGEVLVDRRQEPGENQIQWTPQLGGKRR